MRDCKNRPRGMDVETWCAQNNITKANYYYRLRRVRKACLDQLQTEQSDFIEEVCVDVQHVLAKKIQNQKQLLIMLIYL